MANIFVSGGSASARQLRSCCGSSNGSSDNVVLPYT